MNYAIVKKGVVLNIIVWDGKDGWQPPKGCQAVLIGPEQSAYIGGTYDGSTFSPPASE